MPDTSRLVQQVIDAGNNFTADFPIVNDRGETDIESMWRMSPDSGITGLWYPREPVMAAVDPPLAHHDDLFDALDATLSPSLPVMPWKAATVGGHWQVEVPVPGGSMWSVDLSDEELHNDADDIPPRAVWPVVYTCRTIGVPESAVVTFGFTPRRGIGDPVNVELGMDRLYTELRFTPAGLPDPVINRGGGDG